VKYGWKKMSGKKLRGGFLVHKWEYIYAYREKKRGKAIRRFIVNVKKNWAEESNLIYKNKEGMVMLIIRGEESCNNIDIQ